MISAIDRSDPDALAVIANAAPYLHPRRVWFLPELPLAGANKIDRRSLAQRAAELLSHNRRGALRRKLSATRSRLDYSRRKVTTSTSR
jgi:acyl-CoA synthetase (AMP-forming)/AMP-acid ligase II